MDMTQKARILVADDDEFCRRALCRFLLSHGFDVAEAPTEGKALVLAEHAPVSLCIVDFHLPGNACKRLVAHFRWERDIPCIIVTGDASAETEIKARSFSPDFFFVKPIELADFHSVICNILKGAPHEHAYNR